MEINPVSIPTTNEVPNTVHLHEQKGFFRLELSAIAVVTAAGIVDILYDVICNAHDVLVGVRISDNIQGESKIMEFFESLYNAYINKNFLLRGQY